jgi:hypothetical protein
MTPRKTFNRTERSYLRWVTRNSTFVAAVRGLTMNCDMKCDDRVIITKIRGPLDGELGTVIGWAQAGEVDHYVILLDKPYNTPEFLYKAVVIPEGCIERVQ